jgi:hypothetical protein
MGVPRYCPMHFEIIMKETSLVSAIYSIRDHVLHLGSSFIHGISDDQDSENWLCFNQQLMKNDDY